MRHGMFSPSHALPPPPVSPGAGTGTFTRESAEQLFQTLPGGGAELQGAAGFAGLAPLLRPPRIQLAVTVFVAQLEAIGAVVAIGAAAGQLRIPARGIVLEGTAERIEGCLCRIRILDGVAVETAETAGGGQ